MPVANKPHSLTLCTDLRAVFGLGPKALIMFLTGTVGVVIGGPLAILIVAPFAPELVGVPVQMKFGEVLPRWQVAGSVVR